MASTQPAPPPDRTGRFALVALTVAGLAVLVWLITSLAMAAFSSTAP